MTFDPLELYASGIDRSDYVERVLPLLHAAVAEPGDLLDIGAGGGQLGLAYRAAGQAWVALEPSPTMCRRLDRIPSPPRIVASGWQEADLARASFDTVLAANMAGPLNDPETFLARCRAWARANVVWLVPAQNGPRGLCLAGCLPAEWHGEDETPGVEIVLRQLPEHDRPRVVGKADWSFRLDVASIPAIAAYLADRLDWGAGDARRPALRDHLASATTPVADGFRLIVPRASAVLAWYAPDAS